MQARKTEDTMALIGGALLGAAAMYFLDPQSGQRRRRRLASAADNGIGATRDAAARRMKAVSDRAMHLADHLRSDMSGAQDRAADYAQNLADQAHDIASNLTERAAKYVPGDPRSAVSAGRHWGEKWFGRAQDAWSHARDAAHGYADDAAKYARDHASQVGDMGNRWWDRARGWVGAVPSMAASHAQELRDEAADRSDDLRRQAAKRISHASHRAQGWLGHDEDRGIGAGTILSSTAGCLVVGAGLMYFLDPEKGRSRRNRVAKATSDCIEKTGKSMRSIGHDVAGKLWGGARDAGAMARNFANRSRVDSEQLVQQIRAEISHLSARANRVQLMADGDGDVTVTGEIGRDEVDQLLEALHQVPGVSHVINRMTISGAAVSAQG